MVIFSILGLIIFGGKINSFTVDVYNEDVGTDFDYETLNMNTFINSFIFFFVIALNNDWTILSNLAFVTDDDQSHSYYKFFFVLFKLLVNYIFLYSIIAFVIELFHIYDR